MQLNHFFEVVSFVIFYQSVFIVQIQAKIPTFHSLSSKLLLDDVQSWTHETLLDNGIELFWNANDPEWLIMEISAPTTGYVGVGFSPNGGMAGSDIFLGHVDDSNGTPHLHDYYAEANAAPKLDKSQDAELIVAVQTENRTLIRFRRKWDTSDEEHDIKLTGDDTFYLIWAYSPYDPAETLNWHGPTSRGVRRVFLRTVQTARQFPDEVPIPGVHQLDSSSQNSSFAQVLQFGPCPKLPVEPNFNISGYSGLWYEVEKYWFVAEATATCISVEYFDKKDGTFGVEIAVSDGLTNTTRVMPGSTYFLSNDNSANFMLDITVTQSPTPIVVHYQYLVLGTDYSNYTIKYACRQFGPLNMQNMWILSREKFLYPESKRIIYEKLRNLGLSVNRLIQSTFVNCRA